MSNDMSSLGWLTVAVIIAWLIYVQWVVECRAGSERDDLLTIGGWTVAVVLSAYGVLLWMGAG